MAGFRDLAVGPVDLSVVAYPAVTLFVDLSDGQLTVDDGAGRRPSGSVALGLAPGVLRGGGDDLEILQIRLSPVVAHRVLGGATEIAGGMVGLDDLWGRDGSRFQEQLRTVTSWDDRFALALAALGRRFETGPTVDPEVAFAWAEMTRTRGQVRVDQLAAEVGWSRKRLWSRFRSQIGLTPKRAAQLIRFDHAAHRLAAGHGTAQVAAESGYADQSHLHREVRSFAGTTPSGLSTAWWMAVDDVAWRGRQRVPRT